jgi:hypothetical protein
MAKTPYYYTPPSEPTSASVVKPLTITDVLNKFIVDQNEIINMEYQPLEQEPLTGQEEEGGGDSGLSQLLRQVAPMAMQFIAPAMAKSAVPSSPHGGSYGTQLPLAQGYKAMAKSLEEQQKAEALFLQDELERRAEAEKENYKRWSDDRKVRSDMVKEANEFLKWFHSLPSEEQKAADLALTEQKTRTSGALADKYRAEAEKARTEATGFGDITKVKVVSNLGGTVYNDMLLSRNEVVNAQTEDELGQALGNFSMSYYDALAAKPYLTKDRWMFSAFGTQTYSSYSEDYAQLGNFWGAEAQKMIDAGLADPSMSNKLFYPDYARLVEVVQKDDSERTKDDWDFLDELEAREGSTTVNEAQYHIKFRYPEIVAIFESVEEESAAGQEEGEKGLFDWFKK